jgi:hypothetical protein
MAVTSDTMTMEFQTKKKHLHKRQTKAVTGQQISNRPTLKPASWGKHWAQYGLLLHHTLRYNDVPTITCQTPNTKTPAMEKSDVNTNEPDPSYGQSHGASRHINVRLSGPQMCATHRAEETTQNCTHEHVYKHSQSHAHLCAFTSALTSNTDDMRSRTH